MLHSWSQDKTAASQAILGCKLTLWPQAVVKDGPTL